MLRKKSQLEQEANLRLPRGSVRSNPASCAASEMSVPQSQVGGEKNLNQGIEVQVSSAALWQD